MVIYFVNNRNSPGWLTTVPTYEVIRKKKFLDLEIHRSMKQNSCFIFKTCLMSYDINLYPSRYAENIFTLQTYFWPYLETNYFVLHFKFTFWIEVTISKEDQSSSNILGFNFRMILMYKRGIRVANHSKKKRVRGLF